MKRFSTFVVLMLVASVSAAAGFDDGYYKARAGYFDGDGFLDIYLEHQPVIIFVDVGGIFVPIVTNPRDVAELVLLNNADGTFDVELPTRAEISSVSWEEIDTEAVVDDYNMDGANDVFLKDVASGVVVGSDQIVFASTIPRSGPLSVKAVDTAFTNFYTPIKNVYLDPGYFNRTIAVGYEIPVAGSNGLAVANGYLATCQNLYGSNNCVMRNVVLASWYASQGKNCQAEVYSLGIDADVACPLDGYHIFRILTAVLTVRDFTNVPTSVARFVWLNDALKSGLLPPEAVIDGLTAILESIFGSVSIGGLDTTKIEEIDDPTIEPIDGWIVNKTVISVIRVLFDFRSPASKVVLTMHRIANFGPTGEGLFGPMHLAVAYRHTGIDLETIISAYPQDDIFNGTLVSHTDDPRDRNNLYVAEVVPQGVSSEQLFGTMLLLDNNYPDCLRYDFVPGVPASAIGYNSNSFAKGLIDAAGGIPSAQLSALSFPGVQRPVPIYYFTPASTCN
jgi:hypothetical protein